MHISTDIEICMPGLSACILESIDDALIDQYDKILARLLEI